MGFVVIFSNHYATDMKRNITAVVTCFLILSSFCSFAQRQKKAFKPNLDLHFMPLAIAHPDPSLRFGSELMTKGRFSYGLSLGAGFKGMHLPVVPVSGKRSGNYGLFEIRPEIKFYWLKRETMGWYIAAEGSYVHVKRTMTKSSYYMNDTLQIGFDRASFAKTKFGLVGKMGVKFLIDDRYTMDFFTGLGVALTRVKYSEIEQPKTYSYDPFFEFENFYPGRNYTPLIAIGLKVGVMAWKKGN